MSLEGEAIDHMLMNVLLIADIALFDMKRNIYTDRDNEAYAEIYDMKG